MARSQEEYMKLALAEARQAFEKGEIPVGAVVVCRDRVIGRGHNMTETLNDVTAHAEMMAITSAASTLGGKYLQDCTLYVTVEHCAMCAGCYLMGPGCLPCIGTRDEKKGIRRWSSCPSS
jgi:tRNA(adenine34) deaminase